MMESGTEQHTCVGKVGEKISVLFSEMVSAGYLWTAVADHEDLAIEQTYDEAEDPETVGGFGYTAFTLTAAKPGTYNIVFTHKQPWAEEIHRTVNYQLTINP